MGLIEQTVHKGNRNILSAFFWSIERVAVGIGSGLGICASSSAAESFVCHMHFNYEEEAYQAARPKLDIGHHINNLFFKKGGYSLKLSGGELIEDRQSGFEVND